MNKSIIIGAGIATLLDAFIQSTFLNIVIFIVAGIAAIYFGFKLFKQSKVSGSIAMLVGIELIVFAFIKQIAQYGAAHIAIGIILGLILIVAPFIKNYVKE